MIPEQDMPATPPPDDCETIPAYKEFRPTAPIKNNLSSILASGYRLHECLNSNYTIIDELGSGGFGLVVRAIRKFDGLQVAVKLMWRDRIPKEAWLEAQGWDPKHPTMTYMIPKEAYVLRKVNHPGIIQYIDLFEDCKFVYLVSSK